MNCIVLLLFKNYWINFKSEKLYISIWKQTTKQLCYFFVLWLFQSECPNHSTKISGGVFKCITRFNFIGLDMVKLVCWSGFTCYSLRFSSLFKGSASESKCGNQGSFQKNLPTPWSSNWQNSLCHYVFMTEYRRF